MIRTGIGYDVHQFAEGRPCILGGVEIPHTHGLMGHSDADVLSHAIADSILGALGLPDIGHYFPPGDPSCKDICSLKILEKCAELCKEHDYMIGNIDSSLVAEAPKVLPHAEPMKANIAQALGITPSQVGIKATTNETMGFVGRNEGIAALASALIYKSSLLAPQEDRSQLPPEADSPTKPQPNGPNFTFHPHNPDLPTDKIQNNLPHWSQQGASHFVTWRTRDSIPTPVLKRWTDERENWLRSHRLNPKSDTLSSDLSNLPESARKEYRQKFQNQWEESLDECHGECPLRDPECRKIIADAFRHFDGERYHLASLVIMPNHLHFICQPLGDHKIWEIEHSIKQFTATQINRYLERSGKFWQSESFDHIIRGKSDFEYYCRYIEDNPSKACLPDPEFTLQPLPTECEVN